MPAGTQPQDLPLIYRLTQGQAPWGDYGAMLVHGMAVHPDYDKEGRLGLERTAPWMPALSYPTLSLVATNRFREELECSGMRGFLFRPVAKSRIVKLAWERWDLSAAEPETYPAGGEPENYVLGRKHNPALADQLGDLWEIAIAPGVEESRGKPTTPRRGDEIVVQPSTWSGADIFGGTETQRIYVSARMRAWLEMRVGPLVISFEATRNDETTASTAAAAP